MIVRIEAFGSAEFAKCLSGCHGVVIHNHSYWKIDTDRINPIELHEKLQVHKEEYGEFILNLKLLKKPVNIFALKDIFEQVDVSIVKSPYLMRDFFINGEICSVNDQYNNSFLIFTICDDSTTQRLNIVVAKSILDTKYDVRYFNRKDVRLGCVARGYLLSYEGVLQFRAEAIRFTEQSVKQIKREINKEHHVRTYRIDDIFQYVSCILKEYSSFSHVIKFLGDISSEIIFLSDTARDKYRFTVNDGHDVEKNIIVYVPPSINLKFKKYHRYEITGKLSYNPSGGIKVNATFIRHIAEGELLRRRLEIERNNADLFNVRNRKKLPIKFDSIVCIANSKSQGYKDFIETLKGGKLVSDESIILREIDTYDVEPIVNEIEEVNDYAGIDVIVILRGGGASETLFDVFSDPRLLTAIAESDIPVMTGIGHSDDRDFLLCERVCAINGNAISPTAAAEKINKIVAGQNKKRKANEQKEKMTKLQLHVQELEAERHELMSQNKQLQNTIQELEKELTKLKQRGLLDRVFNV